jgi:hypothetical protein
MYSRPRFSFVRHIDRKERSHHLIEYVNKQPTMWRGKKTATREKNDKQEVLAPVRKRNAVLKIEDFGTS